MNLCLDPSPIAHQKAGLASYARGLAIQPGLFNNLTE